MSSRPRGFIRSWKPQKATLEKLEVIEDVFSEYKAYSSMIIRQVYYRLVGKVVIDKTDQAYQALVELIGTARRAGKISMDAIHDAGLSGGLGTRLGNINEDDFKKEVVQMANDYLTDRQAGQERRLVLWCEAAGMIEQLESIGDVYGVSVKSSGGFDSLSTKHAMGRDYHKHTILHVGDYDPSGECLFDALVEDVEAFAEHYRNNVRVERIAVMPEHIDEFNLITSPAKKSSHQDKKQMFETVQVESLTPVQLANIVRDAIETRMDMDVYRRTVETEKQERGNVIKWVNR